MTGFKHLSLRIDEHGIATVIIDAAGRSMNVFDDEMLMALPPDMLEKAIVGMAALAKNGFRYPFPQYGIQQDVRDGMAASYPDRKR